MLILLFVLILSVYNYLLDIAKETRNWLPVPSALYRR